MKVRLTKQLINEELEFELPIKKLKEIENKFILHLSEYKDYIINNIKKKDDEVIYTDFDNIDIQMILEELEKKFGKETVLFFNAETFLRKIYQILDLKSRRTKEGIEYEFMNYYQSLEERVDEYLRDERDISKEEDHFDKWEGEKSIISRTQYEDEMYELQVELAKLQEWVLKTKAKIAIVFEGRDSAGKGSTIKRFIETLRNNKSITKNAINQ